MPKYVVILSCGKGILAEWYEPQMKINKKAKLFDSFDKAKASMRYAIKKLVSQNNIFGLEEGKTFEPFKFWLEDYEYSEYEKDDKKAYEFADKLINNLIFDESYLPTENDFIELDYDDAGDWHFNYLIEKDRVIVNHYGLHISFNIHSPKNPQNQYFCLRKENADGPLAEISIELLKIDD